jgi:cob(I)alamin adenosyltransferase
MTIYTKTGDQGKTGLIGGTRVAKNDIRLEAYGTLDELNSMVGLLVAEGLDKHDNDFNQTIQHRLFKLCSYLATDQDKTSITFAEPVELSVIHEMELEIDALTSKLPPIERFILPGGSRKSSVCHLCRTICRRAERRCVDVSEHFLVHPAIIQYLNRLSDYYFTLGRKYCISESFELFWDNTK